MSDNEKEDVIKLFNESSDQIMIMITFYNIAFINLNLQFFCWHIYMLKSFYNLSIINQVIHQYKWINNFSSKKIVYNTKYYTDDTFIDREVFRFIEKTISEIITFLNWSIFDEYDEKENVTIEIDDWIETFDDKLCRLKNVQLVIEEVSHIFNFYELFFNILLAVKNEIIVII